MVREWGPAYKYFEVVTENSNGKSERFKCRFCRAEYLRNHTKMLNHLKKQCKLVTELAKQQLSGVLNVEGNPISSFSGLPEGSPGNSQRCQTTRDISNLEGFLDSVTSNEQGHLEVLLARAIFSSASPCAIFESEDWKIFFKRLRPSFKLPGRKKISHILLEDEYARMHSQVTSSIENSKFVTIQCDSWTNIKSEGVTNIIVSTPTPYLFESLQSGSTSQDGQFYCDKVSEVIEKVGPEKVIAFVTDNASVMKKSWRLLQIKYSHLITFGCSAHGLNLLCKDIMNLPRLLKIERFVNSMVTAIKKSSLLTGRLKELQHGSTLELKLSNRTRWISTLMSFTSVLKCKSSIRQLAVDPNYEPALGLDRTTQILSTHFWNELVQVTEIMKPIAKWIVLLQTETKPMIHLVYPAFQEIKEKISGYLETCDLTTGDKSKILESVKKRQSFCIQPVHLAAHLLDPNAQGSLLTSSLTHAALNFIFTWTKKLPFVDSDQVMTDLANFRAQTDVYNPSSYLWAMKSPSMTVVQWWSLVSGASALGEIAVGLLNISPTTATTERSFSTFKIVQSAKRNRLTHERARKLVYLCHNLRLCSTRNVRRIDDALRYIGLDGSSLVIPAEAINDISAASSSRPSEDIATVNFEEYAIIDVSDDELLTEECVVDSQFHDDSSTASCDDFDSQGDLAPVEDDDKDEIEDLFRLATSPDYFNII